MKVAVHYPVPINDSAPRKDRFARLPRGVWWLFRQPPRLLRRLGLGTAFGPPILLLTTVGRVSGKPHVTPLQYTNWKGRIYVGSARGEQADWVLNLQAQPHVELEIGGEAFCAEAEVIRDLHQFVEFLHFRRNQNPRGIELLFRIVGLGSDPSDRELRQHLQGRVMVAFRILGAQPSKGKAY